MIARPQIAHTQQLYQWPRSAEVRVEFSELLNSYSLSEFPNSRVSVDDGGKEWLFEKVRDKENNQIVRVIPAAIETFLFPSRGSWELNFGSSMTDLHSIKFYLEDVQGYYIEIVAGNGSGALYSTMTIVLDNKVYLLRRIPEPLEKILVRSVQEFVYSYLTLTQWEKVFAVRSKEKDYFVSFDFAENYYIAQCSDYDSQAKYQNIFAIINCLNNYGNLPPMSLIKFRQLIPSKQQSVSMKFEESLRSYIYSTPEFLPSVAFELKRSREGFFELPLAEVITFFYTSALQYPGHIFILLERQTTSVGQNIAIGFSTITEVLPYVSLSGDFNIAAPSYFKNLLSSQSDYQQRDFLVIPIRIPGLRKAQR